MKDRGKLWIRGPSQRLVSPAGEKGALLRRRGGATVTQDPRVMGRFARSLNGKGGLLARLNEQGWCRGRARLLEGRGL